MLYFFLLFLLYDTATSEIYTYGHTLSIHYALPVSVDAARSQAAGDQDLSLSRRGDERERDRGARLSRNARICAAVRRDEGARRRVARRRRGAGVDRKSKRLNSSH